MAQARYIRVDDDVILPQDGQVHMTSMWINRRYDPRRMSCMECSTVVGWMTGLRSLRCLYCS